MSLRIGGIAIIFILQGCASIPPIDYEAVNTELSPLLPEPTHETLAKTPLLSAEERHARLSALLDRPLQAVTAQQLALINSPQVQATLAALGIAEADQFQAGLLSNPTLAVGALIPEGGGRWQLDLGLSQSILDLMTRSLRQQLAADALVEAQLQLAIALNHELHQVQRGYYRALGAKHQAVIAELSLKAAAASHELAVSLYEAGNLKEISLLHFRDHWQERERVLRRAQTEAQQAALALAQRLGLDDTSQLTLPMALPGLPDDSALDDQSLIAHALEHRLDIRLARQARTVSEQRLSLYQRSGPLTQLDLGANLERQTNGQTLVGPEVAISLPVFHRNQARQAVTGADLQRSEAQLSALELGARTEIQKILLDLHRTRADIWQLEQEVIPQWQQKVELNLREYNFMLLGAFEVLSAKSREFIAWHNHAAALEDYWVNRAALAMASASPMPKSTPGPVQMPHAADPDDLHHHHETPEADSHRRRHHPPVRPDRPQRHNQPEWYDPSIPPKPHEAIAQHTDTEGHPYD